MANPRTVLHHVFKSMALPYAPHVSVSQDSPRYVSGSNCVVKANGTLARRPGFSTQTADDFGSGNTIERFFHWRSWAGVHYIFCNVITSSVSQVYKQAIGTDTAFKSIFSSTATEPFDFVVANNAVFYGNGTDMRKYDGTNEYRWGIVAPTVAPSAAISASGNVPAAIQHKWVYAFENSTTTHLSDVSPASNAVTAVGNQWQITGSGSSDPQVDQIRIYRTEDGGSVFFDLSTSPIADPGAATWTLNQDNDSDDDLSSNQAPVRSINTVPTAGRGLTFFAGRIWWFEDDTLYYTGSEEVNNGRDVESAPTDNQRRFGQEITGLATVSSVLLIFTRNGIHRIAGDSLSTFRRDILSSNYGVHNRIALASSGDVVGWLDVANVVRVSNGDDVQEISQPIRSDIESINHANAHMAFWDDGIRHWLVLMDGGNNRIHLYDFDHGQWQPPWDITVPTAVGVGQTADGTHRLFLGRTNGSTNVPLRMNTSNFQDQGSNYTANITTALLTMVEEGNPMERGNLQHVIIERNAVSPSDVLRAFDEDPTAATFTSIAANSKDPPGRDQGSTLVETWYDDRADTGKRAAVQISWAAASTEFQVHSLSVGYRLQDR